MVEKLTLPKKLKKDFIVEALCEIRFESDDLEEVMLASLASSGFWAGYPIKRLPGSSIPHDLKEFDPRAFYQPVLERRSQESGEFVRLSPRSISYHVVESYPGGDEFVKKVIEMANVLMRSSTSVKIRRIGFRYINIVRKDYCPVTGVSDLSISLLKNSQPMGGEFNFTYLESAGSHHQVTTRLATPHYIQGKKIADAICAIDIDVFTPDGFLSTDAHVVSEWVELAHRYEKESFFSHFSQQQIKTMEENI